MTPFGLRNIMKALMNKPNEERNKAIIEKKNAGASFRELARFFHLQVSTIHEIYHRDKMKYGKPTKKPRRSELSPRERLPSVRS